MTVEQAYGDLVRHRWRGGRRRPSRGFLAVLGVLAAHERAHNYLISQRTGVTQQEVGRILERMIGYGIVRRCPPEVINSRTRICFELTETGRAMADLPRE